jgi:hypothetical protein
MPMQISKTIGYPFNYLKALTPFEQLPFFSSTDSAEEISQSALI